MNLKIKGNKGEKIATDFLIKSGYYIIVRNYFTRQGEIDIIAAIGDSIVFIEVKTWDYFGVEGMEYTINATKKKRMINIAKTFLSDNLFYEDFFQRFDIIYIGNNLTEIMHIKNAFSED